MTAQATAQECEMREEPEVGQVWLRNGLGAFLGLHRVVSQVTDKAVRYDFKSADGKFYGNGISSHSDWHKWVADACARPV